MEGSFADHVVQSTLPVLKICMLGAVGAILAGTVSLLRPPVHGGEGKMIPCLHATAVQQQANAAIMYHFSCMQGILDPAGRRTLSRLIYFVFTPALTFSKLAPVLTAQHLVLWMPLAFNMFLR